MGKEQAKSRNGHNIFEISSLIQKALRRSDTKMALYAAVEMLPKYRNYLWKRLLTVSAEDCHDMVTGTIVKLHDDDRRGSNCWNNKKIEQALSILLNARKNRDADYMACNLFNSRDKREFSEEYGKDIFDPKSATKNGHNLYFLENVFNHAINLGDYDCAGYAANEIKVYYPNYCWDMIVRKASVFGVPQLMNEVIALKKADKLTNFDNTLLFRSKAIVLIIGVIKNGVANYHDSCVPDEVVNISEAPIERLRLPDYVFDCHTYLGKSRGKTKREFVKAEQEALVPHKEGEFDSASWERFFYMCEHGFWTEDYTPKPNKERIDEIENNKTTSLFDL